MNYVWELDVDIHSLPNRHRPLKTEWHLKRVWDKDLLDGKVHKTLHGVWKISVAWVRKEGDRKWQARFIKSNNDKTFRSLKAAKAYAVAIITLEQ